MPAVRDLFYQLLPETTEKHDVAGVPFLRRLSDRGRFFQNGIALWDLVLSNEKTD